MGKKDLIVLSTKKLILEKGYKNISVEDITNDAGIAKGSFYTYFKSKNLVINYILEEKIIKVKNSFIIDRRKNLKDTIKDAVIERVILSDEELKENLVLVNLFRSIAFLDDSTLNLLKELETLMINKMKQIIEAYPDEIKVKKREVNFYAKMLNSIITNYKTFDLFTSKKNNNFIKNIEEVKKKYKNIDKSIEIISDSILKILIY